jgi:hypothetical protein
MPAFAIRTSSFPPVTAETSGTAALKVISHRVSSSPLAKKAPSVTHINRLPVRDIELDPVQVIPGDEIADAVCVDGRFVSKCANNDVRLVVRQLTNEGKLPRLS